MSRYGMLGLLEGAGSGLSKTGDLITKNALLAAQDQREANRERLRLEYAKQQDDANYTRSRTDQLADQKTALDREAANYTRDRADQLADQKTALENKAPSAFMEKVNFYDEKLKNKEISQDQYNTALGLSKSTGLTTDQQIKYKLQANEQASVEILGKDPMQPATPEQIKAIELRASQIFNRATGQGDGNNQSGGNDDNSPPLSKTPSPDQVEIMFKALMKQDPKTWDQEVSTLKDRGYIQAANMLRERLQTERNKLNRAEDQAKGEDMARRNSFSNNRDPRRQPGGLLEQGQVSTLH